MQLDLKDRYVELLLAAILIILKQYVLLAYIFLISVLLPIEVGVIEYKDNKIVFINFAILLLFYVLRFYIILNDGVYMLA